MSTIVTADRKTALYRFFDADSNLLYAGITFDIYARFSSHRADKLWWTAVCRIEIAWYDNREEAEAAEVAAVRDEQPRWNIAIPDEDGHWRLHGRRPVCSTAAPLPSDGDLSPTAVARKLNVSASTVRRWEEVGVLVPRRLPGSNHRRYNRDAVDELNRKIDAGELDATPEMLPTDG